MLINAGRLLMLGVWGFMVLNLIHPFPKPLNYFIHVAMVFTFFMHGLQLTLLKATQGKSAQHISAVQQLRIFLFGVFELLVWQKKFKVKK